MLIPLFFLLLLCFAATAVSKFQVTELPGLDVPLPFELETGYVNIDELNGIELFYYFIKSENNPAKDPIMFWFSGGPGCSGLNALMFGNGPFTVKIVEYTGGVPPIELNPYAWTKVSSAVYVDSPVGTGFSYSTTVEGSYSNDTLSAQQSYTFIRKWLVDHPEFLSNSVIIGGDSYGGQVVPVITYNIAQGIESGDEPPINLLGYLLGNPVTDYDLERNFIVPFSHGMGLISDELYKSLRRDCHGDYIHEYPTNVQCNMDLDDLNKCLEGLWEYDTLLPKCDEIIPELDTNSRGHISSLSIVPDVNCPGVYGFVLSYYWANSDAVQTALNVRKGKVKKWIRCNYSGINYTVVASDSKVPYHAKLSEKRIRSLIYIGDHDPVIPSAAAQTWIKSLNYPIIEKWRPWLVDGKVVGFTKTYANNMTFATVMGAGHVAPATRAKECFSMYSRWLSYVPLYS